MNPPCGQPISCSKRDERHCVVTSDEWTVGLGRILMGISRVDLMVLPDPKVTSPLLAPRLISMRHQDQTECYVDSNSNRPLPNFLPFIQWRANVDKVLRAHT
ncbi:hypothetical protein Bpfe_000377 [Biomphalaria pfeifferi]|uniref:Uncharacterized protein n=1 Tax=Biomphalaria pfeifferi TaxID=112525 RepID=A0AAD8CCN3_BIOPF|nr:hypothetical protein Bpfe_000377 [Biomphalaria pfeifferi]